MSVEQAWKIFNTQLNVSVVLWFSLMGYTIKNDNNNAVFGKNQLFYLDGFPLGFLDLGKF